MFAKKGIKKYAKFYKNLLAVVRCSLFHFVAYFVWHRILCNVCSCSLQEIAAIAKEFGLVCERVERIAVRSFDSISNLH